MSPLSYASATVPVRPDLPEAHTRAWERLAAAGAWWTGAERVAIAQAVRDAATCSLCLERKSALSPHAVDGQHAGEEGSSLPAAAVDAAHRIASDPARLTRAWFEKTQAAGVSDGHYIELVGVVVTIVSIDAFCRGIGVAPHALPQPRPGEPSRARPEHLAEGEAWVPMLTERNLAPSEADVFDGMKKTGNVLRALSLVPDAVRQLRDLSAVHYLTPAQMLDLTGSPRAIDRMQIELVAGRVSALRECFY